VSTAAKLRDTLGKALEYRGVHYSGRFVIRSAWSEKTLLFEVSTKTGMLVAAGFDIVSLDEETPLRSIT
jgi:hypothetical protein